MYHSSASLVRTEGGERGPCLPSWPLVAPQHGQRVLDVCPCLQGFGACASHRRSPGWPTPPASRPFFLYAAVRACYALPTTSIGSSNCKPEELSREERLLSRPTGRSHNDDIGSAT